MRAKDWENQLADIQLPRGEVHVWFSQSQNNPDDLATHAGMLSYDEAQRASRLKVKEAQDQFIHARSFLRRILGSYLRKAPEEIHFGYGEFGKPIIDPQENPGGLQFNLSHRDGNTLLAVGQQRQIGIDLEALRIIPEAEQIVASYFSNREAQAYSQLDPSLKPAGLMRGWICKEAYLKALGKGLYRSLQDFSVAIHPGEPPKILEDQIQPGFAETYHLVCFEPAPGYVAALAVEGSNWSLRFMNFSSTGNV